MIWTSISRRTCLVLPLLFGLPWWSTARSHVHRTASSQEPERKSQLLLQRRPSDAGGLADAIVIKDADFFFWPGTMAPCRWKTGMGWDCIIETAGI